MVCRLERGDVDRGVEGFRRDGGKGGQRSRSLPSPRGEREDRIADLLTLNTSQ